MPAVLLVTVLLMHGCCTGPAITSVKKYRVQSAAPLVVSLKFSHAVEPAESAAFCRVLKESNLFGEVICGPSPRRPVDLVIRVFRASAELDTHRGAALGKTWATLTFCSFWAGKSVKAQYWFQAELPNQPDAAPLAASRGEGEGLSHAYICGTPVVSWLALAPFWTHFVVVSDAGCEKNIWAELADQAAVALVNALRAKRETLLAGVKGRKPEPLEEDIALLLGSRTYSMLTKTVPASQTNEATLENRPILAVMDIEDQTRTFKNAVLDAAVQILRNKLTETRKYVVVDKTRQEEALSKMVKETKKESYKACYDQRCQIPLGQAVAADTILSCRITAMADIYTLGCTLTDLAREAAVAGASDDFDGTVRGLKTAVDAVSGKLAR